MISLPNVLRIQYYVTVKSVPCFCVCVWKPAFVKIIPLNNTAVTRWMFSRWGIYNEYCNSCVHLTNSLIWHNILPKLLSIYYTDRIIVILKVSVLLTVNRRISTGLRNGIAQWWLDTVLSSSSACDTHSYNIMMSLWCYVILQTHRFLFHSFRVRRRFIICVSVTHKLKNSKTLCILLLWDNVHNVWRITVLSCDLCGHRCQYSLTYIYP